MNTFRRRLLGTILIWIGVLLAGLLIIIGQLFPIYATTDNPQFILFSFTGIFIVAMLISTIVGHRIIQIHSFPIENVTETAQELAKGNYRARAFEHGFEGTIHLSSTINVLARNLQEITAIKEMEQERLKTLIENMGSALIMIDRQGKVSIVNKTFLSEYDLSDEAVRDSHYNELEIPPKLKKFIDSVFMTEMPARDQLEVSSGIHTKHVDAYGAPVIGTHERWLGIVIVSHDITDLKRLEEIRKDFVANVSHELRTPVTSIKGFSETLLDGAYKDTPSLLSFLEIIQNESNRLEMLIKDLLDLSKVEKADFKVDARSTDMSAVIERAIELVTPKAEEKELTLTTELQPLIVHGDANRLIQVMTNLLINAVTYSSSQTTISIRMFKKEEKAVIQVIDQGIGMEQSEIGRIFERFYRVDRARSRNSGGTGLGLSIVKHLVEAHNGKVEVKSTVGKGTTFTIYLPLGT